MKVPTGLVKASAALLLLGVTSCAFVWCCEESCESPSAPPVPHHCAFNGATDNSELIFCLSGACPFVTVNISGEIDIACGSADGSGKRKCDCSLQSFSSVAILGIGIVCVDSAGPCPSGEYECDGGAALDVDLVAEHESAGTCTSNAGCASQCATRCAALGKSVFNCACEGFCQGGSQADQACDCDVATSATCICDDTTTCTGGTNSAVAADCTAAPQGSCEGKDDERSLGDLDCHCECIDAGFGGASAAGTLQCPLNTAIRIETQAPCDNVGVLVRLRPQCGVFTSGSHTARLNDANENNPSPQTLGPLTSTGSKETCANFDTSITTGFELVSNQVFLDTTVGDLISRFRVDCQ
jgi:hypothetical protein